MVKPIGIFSLKLKNIWDILIPEKSVKNVKGFAVSSVAA